MIAVIMAVVMTCIMAVPVVVVVVAMTVVMGRLGNVVKLVGIEFLLFRSGPDLSCQGNE